MKIYFAGPLFNKAEKRFNANLANDIESLGFEVFLPQRDGIESSKPPYDKMTKEEKRKSMFELDRDKIIESDIFLIILDGRVPDEGACVELGIAYSSKKNKDKLLVGLQTDIRAAFLGSRLSPMIRVPLDSIFTKEEDLMNCLRDYRNS